jgi:hypothetical protein
MATAADILGLANQQIGKPYVWGATGPGSFDCSGLVEFVFGHFGVNLPRTSQSQWAAGPQTTNPGPGDLVFFDTDPPPPGHVGIVTDNGQTMVDAPNPRSVVRYDPIHSFAPVVGFTSPLSGPGGGGGGGPAPAGDSAGTQITNFFNDDPSPIDGSGPGGMAGHNDPQDNRPTFWDRATSPFTKNLLHGSMKTVQAPHFTVYFMFNPQSVDFKYGFTQGSIPIAEQDTSLQNDAQLLMNQTITFSLLFDRIYEVGYWEWSKKNGGAAPNLSFPVTDLWSFPTGPHTDGVNWDIRAIERLIGIYDVTRSAKPAPPGDLKNPSPAPGQLISNDGIPMGNAVDVALGSMAAPIFRGYVGGLTVNYTRFNEKMVPVRAEVEVTLFRLQLPHPEKISVPANFNPYVTTPTVY